MCIRMNKSDKSARNTFRTRINKNNEKKRKRQGQGKLENEKKKFVQVQILVSTTPDSLFPFFFSRERRGPTLYLLYYFSWPKQPPSFLTSSGSVFFLPTQSSKSSWICKVILRHHTSSSDPLVSIWISVRRCVSISVVACRCVRCLYVFVCRCVCVSVCKLCMFVCPCNPLWMRTTMWSIHRASLPFLFLPCLPPPPLS